MQKQHAQNRGDERLHRVKHGAKARVHHPQAVIPERMGYGGAENAHIQHGEDALRRKGAGGALQLDQRPCAGQGQGAANRNQRDLHRVVAAADAANDDRGGGPEEDADQHHQHAGGVRRAAHADDDHHAEHGERDAGDFGQGDALVQKERGENRDEDGVHRAQQRGERAGQPINPQHLQAEAGEIPGEADGKENRPVAPVHGLQRPAQAQDEQERRDRNQIAQREQRHRGDGAQRDLGDDVLAAPKHESGEQGNQAALVHMKASL